MTPRVKGAIGRLRATRGDGGQETGTAFLVSERHLLTAFHLVGNRKATIRMLSDIVLLCCGSEQRRTERAGGIRLFRCGR
jgi:hypothetical protein